MQALQAKVLPYEQHLNSKLKSLTGDLNSWVRGPCGRGGGQLHAIPAGRSAAESCMMEQIPTACMATAVIFDQEGGDAPPSSWSTGAREYAAFASSICTS